MARPCLPMPRLVLTLACALALTLVRVPAASGAAPARDLPALTAAVAEVETLVARAYFRKAIQVGESVREWADDIPRSADAKQARARLEVLLCTAQVALGKRSEARRSMGRAVYVWPLLHLDESDTSPRVLELFREVRGGHGTASRSSR